MVSWQAVAGEEFFAAVEGFGELGFDGVHEEMPSCSAISR